MMCDELRDAIESARLREAPFKGYSPVDGTPTGTTLLGPFAPLFMP